MVRIKRLIRGSALLVLLFAAAEASAALKWHKADRPSLGSSASAQAFCDAMAAAESAIAGATIAAVTPVLPGGDRPPSLIGETAHCGMHVVATGNNYGSLGENTIVGFDATLACVFSDAALDGDGDYTYGNGTVPGGSYCGPISHCKVEIVGPIVKGESWWIGTKRVTNATCTNDDALTGTSEGSCRSGGGTVACAPPPNSSCGYVNGDYVCIGSVDPGRCGVYGSGAAVCVSDATNPPATPPVPDNGTPGSAAVPDVTIYSTASNTTNQVTNYYSPGTVAGSSDGATGTPVGSTGSDAGIPGGSADGEGCEGEDCHPGESASGGEYCSAPPSCEGDALMCAMIDQQWRTRCETQDVAAESCEALGLDEGSCNLGSPEFPTGGDSVVDILELDASGLGGGTCPASQHVMVFGQDIEIPFTPLCDFFTMIAPIVLIAGYLAAAFILFKG